MLPITESLLIGLAGQAAYERGLKYFEQDAVLSLEQDGNNIAAQVQGNQVYHVDLRRTAKVFEGVCECPASDGIDFCKHCVAAALQLKAQDEVSETKPKSSGTKKEQLNKLRVWLDAKPKAEILDSLLGYIDADKAERDRWLMRLDIATGQHSLRSLKKFITNTTRITKAVHKYRDVRRVFDKFHASIEQLHALAPDVQPEIMIGLAAYGMERLDRMLHYVDDSGGFRYESQALLQNMLLIGLAKLDASDQEKMVQLVSVWQSCEFDSVGEVPNRYDEAFSENIDALFIAEVEKRWEQLPTLPENAEYEDTIPYRGLQYELQRYYRSQGEHRRAVEIAEKTAVDATDMLAMAESWLTFGDVERATHWLRRYDKVRSDHPAPGYSDEGAQRQRLQMQVHTAQGEPASAAELAWQRCQHAFSMRNYQTLQEYAAQAGEQDTYRDRAIELLSAKVMSNRASSDRVPDQNRNLLVSVLLFHDLVDQAWQYAHGHAIYENNLVALARKSGPEFKDKAVESLKRMIAVTVQRANNGAYQDAVGLVNEVEALLSEEEFATYLDKLRDSFRAKRNFVGYLDDAYPR